MECEQTLIHSFPEQTSLGLHTWFPAQSPQSCNFCCSHTIPKAVLSVL